MRNSTKNYDYFSRHPRAWLALLFRLFKSPDQIEKFRTWLGYCLARNTDNRQLLILETPSAKARKLITKTIRHLVGFKSSLDDNIGIFLRSKGYEYFLGKSLAVLDTRHDPGKYSHFITSSISEIVSNEPVLVTRLLYDDFREVLPLHLIISADDASLSNELSNFDEFSVLNIELTDDKFKNDYAEISDKLRLELPKIARWAFGKNLN